VPGIASDMARGSEIEREGGRDVSGRPFPRKRDGSPSNLIDSGRMVESFKPTEIRPDGFTLSPTGKRNRAVAHIPMPPAADGSAPTASRLTRPASG